MLKILLRKPENALGFMNAMVVTT